MITTPFETAACGFPISNRRTATFHPLRVSNTDAQIKLGDMPSSGSRVLKMYSVDYRGTRELANSLILAQTCNAGHREGEQYPGSPEHYLYSGSAEHKQCLGSAKEKGSTANAALWDDWFFNHVENQHYPALDFDRVTERCADNFPSLRGEALRLQVTQSHPQNSSGVAQNHTDIIGDPHSPDNIGSVNYEIFVGQSFGSSFDFLRWRRLISPLAAVTKKPAVLSPPSLSNSISSITSWGIRTVVICDLAFFAPVTITDTPCIWCMSVYAKKITKKDLWCISPWYSLCMSGEIHHHECKARQCANTNRASNHNVTEVYTMASSHSTQTRPEKHLWRFLALDRADMNAIPRRISVEAHTEHDARLVLAPYFILSLAARLPAQGVCNV